jgi:hypothetical protein
MLLRTLFGHCKPAAVFAGVFFICASQSAAAIEWSQLAPTQVPANEFRIGIAAHDVGAFGKQEEEGEDYSGELRLALPRWGWVDFLQHPRAMLGVNVNNSADTSAAYGGLSWHWPLGRHVFIGFDFGLAVHDGETETIRTDRKELGTRVLFREALELGVLIQDKYTLSLRLDHISNGHIIPGGSGSNEGLDTFGIMYGMRF